MTYIGTTNSHRIDVPEFMKKHKARPPFESRFIYSQHCTMTSWVPKENKAVVVISSQNFDDDLKLDDVDTSDDEATKDLKQHQRKVKKVRWRRQDPATTKKPLIIHHYNRTKSAVDSADKMTKQYTTRRATYRWTLASFFNLLDIASINGTVVYCLNNRNSSIISSKYNYRYLFLKNLAYELVIPLVKRRKSQGIRLSPRIKYNMERTREMEPILAQSHGTVSRRTRTSTLIASTPAKRPRQQQTQPSTSKDVGRKRCYICKKDGEGSDYKYSNVCDNCFQTVCKKHMVIKTSKRCLEC